MYNHELCNILELHKLDIMFMNCIIFTVDEYYTFSQSHRQRPRMRILHRRLISRAYRLAPETINQLKHRLRSCTTENIARGACREANTACTRQICQYASYVYLVSCFINLTELTMNCMTLMQHECLDLQ